jgi:uncharacterized protein (DUF305 family)
MQGRAVLVGAVVSVTALLAGCSQSASHHEATPAASQQAMPSMAMPSGSASADDIMFAQMMIPHHEQAVVIAELAKTRAADPRVTALAAQITAAQAPEIEQMAGWLREWGAPRLTEDEAMAAHGGHGMSGMLTPEVLDELRGLSGADFDRRFAAAMIEHHRGAIEMAQPVTDSANPEVASLAQRIVATQQDEIDQLTPIAEG